MIKILFIFGVMCCVFATNNIFDLPKYPGLRARFDYSDTIGETYYFDIPRNETAALKKGWRSTERPAGGPKGLAKLKMYCPHEKNFCVFFDDTGYIAGIQYALNQDRYVDGVYNLEVQGFSKWKVNGKSYWAIQQYFVDEKFLQRSAKDRVSSRTAETLQADGIWVTTNNKTLLHVPGTATAMEAAGFLSQKCVQGKGLHYLYKPTTIACTSETWLPWVPIVHNGILTGCIFNNIGKLPPVRGERNWFEVNSASGIKATLPAIPQCMLDLAKSNGVLSIHTFYFGNPWTITCCPKSGTP